MLNQYSQSLKSLLCELYEARKAPYSDVQKWLIIQLKILKKIRYIESKIQENKVAVNQLKRDLKIPNHISSKIEAQKIKSDVNKRNEKIEDYKFLLFCFKSVADGIAFTFINKFDIKPQNFKESSGYLTGKDGLKMELKVLRFSFKKGLVAILNDLTTVLKYNDLTLLTSNSFLSLEIKSSEFDSLRIQRQKIKSDNLLDYLNKGSSTELYGIKGDFLRQNIETPQKYYSKKINSIINKSRERGIAHSLVEPGLVYFVCHLQANIEKELDTIKAKYLIVKPLVHFLNSNKFHGEAYYPFSLSLSPNNYLGFLMGEFLVLIILDLNYIENISLAKGFTTKYIVNNEWVLEFYSSDGEIAFKISYHFLGRIFNEFISAKQLVEESLIQYHKIATHEN